MGLAKKYSPPSSLQVLSCSYHLYSLLLKTSVYHLLTLNSLITFQSSMYTQHRHRRRSKFRHAEHAFGLGALVQLIAENAQVAGASGDGYPTADGRFGQRDQ